MIFKIISNFLGVNFFWLTRYNSLLFQGNTIVSQDNFYSYIKSDFN